MTDQERGFPQPGRRCGYGLGEALNPRLRTT
jgi:hypothetical protein